MIASKTNVSPLATLTVSPESALQDINVITDGDYSAVYSDTLTTSTTITFNFANPQKIDYIAIGGSNVSKKDRVTIRSLDTSQNVFLFSSDSSAIFSSDSFRMNAQYDNSINDSNLALDESRVLMYRPLIENSSQIEITVYGTGQLSIADIAMGEEYEIPRGEQSGYNRPWSIPNIEARSAVGLDNSPISLSYQSRALSCTLSIPNNVMSDFDGWYEFIKFAANNTFYILEDNDKFHSYACFNAIPDMTKAHSQTRSLGNSMVKFNVFAKSNEALL
tara:strand:- start:448 stop:1275 length:828 start_codon:yes stop_codon:yes gene_type:complete